MDPGILVASVAGVVGTAAILRMKRRHAEEYLAAHGPLPGPATSKPGETRAPAAAPARAPAAASASTAYTLPSTTSGGGKAPSPTADVAPSPTAASDAAPLTAAGFSRYLTQRGRFVRDIDMGRVTREGRVTPHWGMDILCPVGTPVYALKPGLVTHSRMTGTFGNVLAIGQDDGKTAMYVHLQRLLVPQGQRVVAGQHVADSGNTGTSRGPHLHFEIQNGATAPDLRSSSARVGSSRNISPAQYLAANGIAQFGQAYTPGQDELASMLDFGAVEGDYSGAMAGYAPGMGSISSVMAVIVPLGVVIAGGALLLELLSHAPKRRDPIYGA